MVWKERSRGGRERKLSEGEFRVTPQGGDIVHQWLELQHTIGQDPFQENGGTQTLPLGGIELQDPLLTAIASRVSYLPDKLAYELQTVLVFPKKEIQARSLEEALQRIAQLGGEIGLSPLDLSEIRRLLASNPTLAGYNITCDQDGGELLIKPPADAGFSPLTEGGFVLHLGGNPMQPAYCLHFVGVPDGSQDGFQRIYQTFASLSGVVVRAVYKSKGMGSPDVEFNMSPPSNTGIMIERAKKALSGRKRMLSAAGLDDGEALAEEVKAKILLEEKPNVTLDDIGGLDEAKEEMRAIVHGLKHPEDFEEWGTFPPRGILLIGPPGTGKTLLAKALAHEAEASIFVVRLADIMNALYGKTEKLIQEVFNLARQNGPVIIFIDELEALARPRGHSTEVSDHLVSILLTNMDGLEERGNIVVVGATNMLEAVDEALLRPGRFTRIVDIPLPDKEARAQILGIHMGYALKRARREIFGQLDLDTLVAETDGFSGDDLREIVRRVLDLKVRQTRKGLSPTPATTGEMLREIEKYEPVRTAMAAEFEARRRRARETMGFISRNP